MVLALLDFTIVWLVGNGQCVFLWSAVWNDLVASWVLILLVAEPARELSWAVLIAPCICSFCTGLLFCLWNLLCYSSCRAGLGYFGGLLSFFVLGVVLGTNAGY